MPPSLHSRLVCMQFGGTLVDAQVIVARYKLVRFPDPLGNMSVGEPDYLSLRKDHPAKTDEFSER